MYENLEIKLKTEKFISLIKRLFSYSGSDSKISSGYLASLIFNNLETQTQKKEVIALFKELVKSEYPQVRKHVTIALKNVLKNLSVEFQSEYVSMILSISEDKIIMVKYYSIHLIEILSSNLKEKAQKQRLMNIIKEYLKIDSWKLKVGVLEKIENVY